MRHNQAEDLEEEPKYLGSNIRYLRKKLGKTQEDVGDDLNWTKVTISNYEKGKTFPDKSGLRALANYFHVTPKMLRDINLEEFDGIKLNAENVFNVFDGIMEIAIKKGNYQSEKNIKEMEKDPYWSGLLKEIDDYCKNPEKHAHIRSEKCINALIKIYDHTKDPIYLHVLIMVHIDAWYAATSYTRNKNIDVSKIDTENINFLDIFTLDVKIEDSEENKKLKSHYLKRIKIILGQLNKYDSQAASFYSALLPILGIDDVVDNDTAAFGIQLLKRQADIHNEYSEKLWNALLDNINE